MVTWTIICRRRIASALMLVGLATSAQGQPTAVPFGGEFRDLTQIRGKVVCVDCRFDEVRRASSAEGNLYELEYRRGAVVMDVNWVCEKDAARWESIANPSHRLWVRASAKVFQELMAEENRFKEVTITGILRSDRIFDIGAVTIGR